MFIKEKDVFRIKIKITVKGALWGDQRGAKIQFFL